MYDKNIITLIFILVTIFWNMTVSNATYCDRNNPCKYDGTCYRGRCICSASCFNKGAMIMCGEDGNHYMNYCFLKMQSCEQQREIKIRCVGMCSTCDTMQSNNPRQKVILSSQVQSSMTKVCSMEDTYCLNYGLCVKNSGVRTCICPHGYTGERCERKEHRKTPYRSQPLIGTNDEDIQISKEVSITFTLVLCATSAMGVGIIASFIYYRIRLKKIQNEENEETTNEKDVLDIINDNRTSKSFYVTTCTDV
ncbi:tomoregulin-1-like isoform X2 [Styela clava]|uniref:tomoregulin-1-like isoform X2 n=1 Tax=Styela clava TaxID=7725 RepID=UPI00193933EB|nr:tomoregulin-1-like isoform X2 [Styela clava]